MKMKKIISNFKFCQDLVNIFTVYTKCLEDYFSDEKNINDHWVLYNYYIDLDVNVKNAVKKNGVLENE